jgi:Fucose permease
LLIILYLGFISLGLPDTVLGVAWPRMRLDLAAPLEWAGGLMSLTTALSVLASLAAGWLMRKYHAGQILAGCALMTSLAMLGYGLAPGFAVVAGFTILFGLGQGAVDSAVNAHMARHYSARQMNWIHSCWGLGATGGPLIFTAVFGLGLSWRAGYLTLFAIQLSLGLLFTATLGLWRNPAAASADDQKASGAVAPQPEVIKGRSRRAAAGVAFYFFYPGLEVVTGLWAASYLMEALSASAAAAGAALTLYWANLTLGRLVIGFAANRFSNSAVIRAGLALAAVSLGLMLLPPVPGQTGAVFTVGLGLLGLGLSPLYPTMMHETPRRAGPERSDQVISFQVGAALAGAAVLPLAAGLIIRQAGLAALPRLMVGFAVLLIAAHEVSAER